MKTGTKSILFGVHQFLWHPVTVYVAWVWLYRKLPSFKEAFCIFIHDWGYWGCSEMDDKTGEEHPEFAAAIAEKLLGPECGYLCLLHSRHYAKRLNRKPSLLCWADKLSILFDPWWFYLPRAWSSGELFEYRCIADVSGFVSIDESHRTWFSWVKDRLATIGKERRGDAVPYMKQGAEGCTCMGSPEPYGVWCPVHNRASDRQSERTKGE